MTPVEKQIKNSYRKSARNRGLCFYLTDDRLRELIRSNCHYCGSQPNNEYNYYKNEWAYIYQGIDRVDSDEGYTADNVVPCCKCCNYAKGRLSERKWYAWIDKLTKFQMGKDLDTLRPDKKPSRHQRQPCIRRVRQSKASTLHHQPTFWSLD